VEQVRAVLRRRAYAGGVTRTLALLLAAGLLTGCSGSGTGTTVAAASPSPQVCPDAPSEVTSWPSSVPAELPVPPTAGQLSPETRAAGGLTLLRFTTSQSVRQGVVFLAGALQPAGFTLGRGDAEAAEADVPFSRGDLRGLLKMTAEGPCRTRWVLALATQRAGAPESPLLPRRSSASPSPLPFG
jgi:hypothetical protein